MSNSSLIKLRQVLRGRNLYLVGMMGSGKSSTGPLLSKALEYGFVDSDAVIEQLMGLEISQIFEQEGEPGFRDIESKVLQSIGERHSLVVSTGGGVVLRTENWGVLHQGIVVWVDPAKEVLIKRLKSDQVKRPLLSNMSEKLIDDLSIQRKPFYSEADLHINIKNESLEKVTQRILDGLAKIVISPEGPDVQQTTAM